MIGIGKPNTSASSANHGGVRDGDAEQRVGEDAPEVVEARPRWARDTRFVSWKLITSARTIGNHANTPNTTGTAAGTRACSARRA